MLLLERPRRVVGRVRWVCEALRGLGVEVLCLTVLRSGRVWQFPGGAVLADDGDSILKVAEKGLRGALGHGV